MKEPITGLPLTTTQTMLNNGPFKSFLYLIAQVLLLCIGCSKSVECDQSRVCIVNNSNTHTQTFYYGFTQQDIILEPNKRVCLDAGNVKILGEARGGNGHNTYATYQCVDENPKNVTHQMKSCYETIVCECSGVYKSEFCNNNRFDPHSGEQDVDCGGYCEPCAPFKDQCTLYQDSISVPEKMGESSRIKKVTGEHWVESDKGIELSFYFEPQKDFLGYTRNSSLKAKLHLKKMPKESRIFKTGNYDHDISLTFETWAYNNTYPDWVADTGQTVVLIKTENGSWKLNLCSMLFVNPTARTPESAMVQGQFSFYETVIEEK